MSSATLLLRRSERRGVSTRAAGDTGTTVEAGDTGTTGEAAAKGMSTTGVGGSSTGATGSGVP